MIPPETIRAVLSKWNLSLKTIRTDCDLQGSPERSLFRTACENEAGRLFVIEQIAPDRRERRQLISSILRDLHAVGLDQVVPYVRTPGGEHLIYCKDAWWQVAPFIAGTPLDRPGYLHDAAKGEALAQFLVDFFHHAKNLPSVQNMPHFSLKDYILKLEQDISRHTPDVAPRFVSIFDFLRKYFMDAYDTLPAAFCHGDFHPLNIVWRGDDITAVIDWEFCGLKPEIYDAANLIGCVGVEYPSGLTDNFTAAFIHRMRESSSISAESWSLFPEFVLALRCAWLAEWLRGKDEEMIDLEETYMRLLIDNIGELSEAWGLRDTAK